MTLVGKELRLGGYQKTGVGYTLGESGENSMRISVLSVNSLSAGVVC